MTGSSGATVKVFDTYARKEGDTRVGAQGAWLLKHQMPTLPEVHDVKLRSYTMERLDLSDPMYITADTTLKLLEPIWKGQAVVQFDLDAAAERLMPICSTYASRLLEPTWDALVELRDLNESGDLAAHEVHGDPTRENVMMRPATGELVLIDPLPPTKYAPDLKAVDLGKILQSSAGYECARYSNHFSSNLDVDLDYVHEEFGDAEGRAAILFCLIHFVRALPYVPDDARVRLLNGPITQVVEYA